MREESIQSLLNIVMSLEKVGRQVAFLVSTLSP